MSLCALDVAEMSPPARPRTVGGSEPWPPSRLPVSLPDMKSAPLPCASEAC